MNSNHAAGLAADIEADPARKPGTPMDPDTKYLNYERQNRGRRYLTPRQTRRYRKTLNKLIGPPVQGSTGKQP